MRIAVVFITLAGFTLAGNVTVFDRGVPRHARTGAKFLPPVASQGRHSVPSIPRSPASLTPLGIDSFPSPDSTPFGLAWDGDNLWHVDLLAREVYALDPDSGAVRTSFFAPDDWSKGLCWDGAYLWLTGNFASSIYKVDPGSGSVVQQFLAPGSNPTGLAFDGTYLWNSDINSDQSRPSFIFKLDPASGAVLDSFAAPCRMVADMDWDGALLWVCDMDAGLLYGMDPATGAVEKASGTPGPQPTGITFRGGRIVSADLVRRRIYTFHPDSGPPAISIDRPARWDVLPTWRNPAVIGTVAGADLDSFRLEYGEGMLPAQWLRAGPTRSAPAFRDTLAVWDVSGITRPGPYSLRVKAFFGAAVDTHRVIAVGLDPQIAEGWPKAFANVSPVTAGNITGDANLELIAGTDHQDFINSKLAAWGLDGSGIVGFPVSGIGLCQMPAATGDVNHDGLSEIATGFDLNRSDVYLVDGSGAIMNGWPQDGGYPGSLSYHGITVLADIAGDSSAEVLSGGGMLSAWNAAGDALPGWPIVAEFSSPALADLDGDRHPEIIAQRSDSIFVFKADGSAVSGWPRSYGGSGYTTFPVAGDIDGDHRPEVAFTIGTRLFCINDSGQVLSGFPKTLGGAYANSPVLGDIDNDGRAEVVVVSGNFPSNSIVSVFRPDGTSLTGWPKNLSGQVFRQFNAPVVGDVDGDSFPDILMGFENASEGFEQLYAWDRQGTEIPGWPKLLRFIYGYGITGSPVLADMNQDGLLECAISSNAYWMYSTDIYVWNLGVPYVSAHQPWPMFRANHEMTASLGPVQTGMGERSSPDVRRATPAPTIIRGVLVLGAGTVPQSGASGALGLSRAALLDMSGRKVIDLKPGLNDVRHLAPGVYFVRSQPQTVTRVVVTR